MPRVGAGAPGRLSASFSYSSLPIRAFCVLEFAFVTGKIRFLNERFFGFVQPDDNSPRLFFHANDLVDLVFNEQLKGKQVEFDVGMSEKGPHAINVRPADAAY
jgi:cold shock CspA family protein